MLLRLRCISTYVWIRWRVCVCVCGERSMGNGHETRCATLSHLSGCSIMWNHSATLIPLLTPLIDICAPCSCTTGSECTSCRRSVSSTLAECRHALVCIYRISWQDRTRRETRQIIWGNFYFQDARIIMIRDSLCVSFFFESYTCKTIVR